MNLIDKQKSFTRLIAKFLLWLDENGFEATFGETWRPPETAKAFAAEGKGIPNSLHCLRLAIDLNLFKDGKLLTRSVDYTAAGTAWKALSTTEINCCWGGDFRDSRGWATPDGNHFSIEYGGAK